MNAQLHSQIARFVSNPSSTALSRFRATAGLSCSPRPCRPIQGQSSYIRQLSGCSSLQTPHSRPLELIASNLTSKTSNLLRNPPHAPQTRTSSTSIPIPSPENDKTTMPELTVEDAKRKAAIQAVDDHFDPKSTYVGIGSGTTILYVINAIKDKLASSNNDTIRFVPTGYQSRQAIIKAGLLPIAFDELPDGVLLDMCFDGADEVDDDLNCIKGGGACLFQEKLVAERSKKFVCVADHRKAQSHLLTSWPSIPIEVAPIASHVVMASLRALGSSQPKIRGTAVDSSGVDKSGPLKTDQDFYIVDAPFPKLLTTEEAAGRGSAKGPDKEGRWEVIELAERIKEITGVLEVGLFCGMDGIEAAGKGINSGGQKPVAVYFGNKDGSVSVRKRK